MIIPESSCICFSHLSGSDHSLFISCKVDGYDHIVHVNTCTGDFLLSKSPYGLVPRDTWLATDRAHSCPVYPWTSSSACRSLYGGWLHPPGLANRIDPKGCQASAWDLGDASNLYFGGTTNCNSLQSHLAPSPHQCRTPSCRHSFPHCLRYASAPETSHHLFLLYPTSDFPSR